MKDFLPSNLIFEESLIDLNLSTILALALSLLSVNNLR